MTALRDNNLSWTINHHAIPTKSHPYRRDTCSMSQGRIERVEDLIKMKQWEVSEAPLVHLTIYLGKWYFCHSRGWTGTENALFIVMLYHLKRKSLNIRGVSSMGTGLVKGCNFLQGTICNTECTNNPAGHRVNWQECQKWRLVSVICIIPKFFT